MHEARLSPSAFARLRRTFQQASGIELSPAKQTLVAARLRSRLGQLGLHDYDAYCDYLARNDDQAERQVMIDLLTTHETYFFREPDHFHTLARLVAELPAGLRVRVWSAACSSGEEPYSIAMTLSECLGERAWEVCASDISHTSLAQAARGLYRIERIDHLPPDHLKKYCLRGTGDYAGHMLVTPELRRRVKLFMHNLLEEPRQAGHFHAVFLRNVLIYFEQELKLEILARVVKRLHPGGWLFIGHSESLLGEHFGLERIAKAVYRKQ
jgi:chemotaxis protein methyltransferase CheR